MDPRPIVDLIIAQADPKQYTETYMQVGTVGGWNELLCGRGWVAG